MVPKLQIVTETEQSMHGKKFISKEQILISFRMNNCVNHREEFRRIFSIFLENDLSLFLLPVAEPNIALTVIAVRAVHDDDTFIGTE